MQTSSPLQWIYRPKHRYRMLGLSLLALHGGVFLEQPAALRSAFLFVHFGLFLLWQPLISSTTKITPRAGAALLGIAALVILIPGWAPLAVWLLILIGLMSGEHVLGRRDRLAQLCTIVYLFGELLLGVVPVLFEIETLGPLLSDSAQWLNLIPPILLLFLNAWDKNGGGLQVDYIRSLAVMLFALMLTAGSVLSMYRFDIEYPIALFQTLLATTAVLIVINWVWRTQSSHSFFQLLWNRYLLNLGSPLEHYLIKLADKEVYKLSADDYLEAALHEFSQLDWVSGVAWSTEGTERIIGHRTGFVTRAEGKSLTILVYTEQEVGPTFVLHIQLLARLTEQFYLARLHESQLKKHSHLQAIYETGSRLTHDIKNLLQSLQSVSAVAQAAEPEQSEEALDLIKRQLPEINKRLQLTLEKLKRPNVEQETQVRVDTWWALLKKRYRERPIKFSENLLDGTPIPHELFDNVADNLLENAYFKQAMNKDVGVQVSLTLVGGHIDLSITDDGEAVPEDVAKELFKQNISSSRGLGIGLYHCYQMADRTGYNLRLKNNQTGNVCFSLSGRAD
ncbi:MAG: HAMP domain-containing histidine kinase [Gammaproteobacteria bacterium]|nr:HAMP domain-containing histidine kinase [Gammaproteobacteria bacterium]